MSASRVRSLLLRIADLELGRAIAVSVFFLGEEEMRAINREFAGDDYATNVLSFPYQEREEIRDGLLNLGEILLCEAVIRRDAALAKEELKLEFVHVIIHGMLHLLGYDHYDEKSKTEMEEKEKFYLKELKLENS